MFNALFEKIIKQENELLEGKRFFAPVLPHGKVQTKINNLVYNFVVSNRKKFIGYGILKPSTVNNARVMKEADQIQVMEYLDLFPKQNLLLLERKDEYSFSALDVNIPKGNTISLYTVYFCDSTCEQFDIVRCARTDGAFLFYDSVFYNVELADYLKEQFRKKQQPDKVKFSGLTEAHKLGYSLCYKAIKQLEEEERKKRKLTKKQKVEQALQFGGGVLHRFIDRGSTATVEWEVNGNTYNTTIKMNNTLEVVQSGVCLDGKDSDFDLKTLPFVMTERDRRDHPGEDYM